MQNLTMKYITLILLMAFNINAQVTFSQNPDELSSKAIAEIKAPEINTLEQAAKWADLVAVVQVDDIEYKQVRKLNSEGYAFLNTLVAYKGAKRGEPIAVIAKGFDDNTCYYPDRENEGQRYLAFLKKAPNEKSNVYYGFKPLCQLQILLSDTGQYILRTPTDMKFLDVPTEFSENQTFNDPHAMIDATLWTGIKRQEFSKKNHCKIIETEDTANKYYHLRYTQGIPLYKIRPLLKIKPQPRIKSSQF